jgi:two-component system, NtrC family, response regulator GlrR
MVADDPSGEAEAVGPGSEPTTVTIALQDGREHALVPPLRLGILEGAQAGASFTARRDRIVIGTHESADVTLLDRAVSRFHCEIAVAGGQVVIRDLGSRNGTLVDGVSVLAAHLRSGQTITIGRTQLRFDLGSEPVKVPVAARENFGGLIGSSPAMRMVFSVLERAAASDATLLIEGDTGTGKEATAEAIHTHGRRKGGPFIVVDCGAIPPQLLESELFGHEKGSFTGAIGARQGAFEAAQGGTIFLDEIGELPLELQPKLLRALEKREIKRIGNARHQSVDVRVVAATNRDLRAEVNARRFRSDLYYRLAVLEVRLPPLRERPEEIPALIEHLLAGLGAASAPGSELLRDPAVLADLRRHPWPGNVRELRNYVERCLALREPPPLPRAPEEDAATAAPDDLRAARESWTRDFEKKYLEDLLARHANNVSAAARAAGVDRKYFYRLLWRNGLR